MELFEITPIFECVPHCVINFISNLSAKLKPSNGPVQILYKISQAQKISFFFSKKLSSVPRIITFKTNSSLLEFFGKRVGFQIG